jgi:hypothetical protein
VLRKAGADCFVAGVTLGQLHLSLALRKAGADCVVSGVALGQLHWALALRKAGCCSTWGGRLLLLVLLGPLDPCARAAMCCLCCWWCCAGASIMKTNEEIQEKK